MNLLISNSSSCLETEDSRWVGLQQLERIVPSAAREGWQNFVQLPHSDAPETPIFWEFPVTLPAGHSLCVRFHFHKQFLGWLDFPPDVHRGLPISSAIVTLPSSLNYAFRSVS